MVSFEHVFSVTIKKILVDINTVTLGNEIQSLKCISLFKNKDCLDKRDKSNNHLNRHSVNGTSIKPKMLSSSRTLGAAAKLKHGRA